MIIKKWISFGYALFALCIITKNSQAQVQTVGIFKNTPASFNGYTLLTPLGDSSSYLLDNCGQVVHEWKSSYLHGFSAFLMEDGSLLRGTTILNPVFGNQGGGRIEKVDWNGNLLWEYIYSSPTHQQHHDFAPMPNGNVLLLAFEYKSKAEAIAAGRDSATCPQGLWPEHIIEVKPIGTDSGEIVWEWHAWDHLVQDFDNGKSNYGTVSAHPELFNLNYPQTPAGNPADWLHANAIAYHAGFDQIVMSSRTFSEFTIIDHSTTTQQAAGHSGGLRNKGGDILYRWGNPDAYGRGTTGNRRLFFQHHVHWIPGGLKGAGNLLVFNNGTGRPGGNFSSVDEIIPPQDGNGNYNAPGSVSFGPDSAYRSYSDTFYSAFISGAQRLPNGNTLICSGMTGQLFETDSNGNTVWYYVNPVNASGRIKQGDAPANNLVFRAYRYGKDYNAFTGKNLAPQGYLEKDPFTYDCDIYPLNTIAARIKNPPFIYPNPADSRLYVENNPDTKGSILIYNMLGQEILHLSFTNGEPINISTLAGGMYTCIFFDPEGHITGRAYLAKQ